jgi:hypothetical protein
MKSLMVSLTILICILLLSSYSERGKFIKVNPAEYVHALRNPLMGFSTRGIADHPWATTAQTYIQWNEIENSESDGIDKIKKVCDEKWQGIEDKNVKVIPRVYLHWSGDRKYWPADMQKDDYTSQQFQERVLRLIKRLGECWDNDPRIAFIEMGIFGKWGEQEQPFPTKEVEKLVGDAFAKAFKNKKVSVREVWNNFTQHPYGEYWDSWAHYDQMWRHGNNIKKVNEDKGRYKETYIGGEVAYDWGNGPIQPGASPTASVAEEKHRNFVINSIRWLHCTQLRWIENYDRKNEAAVKGAEEIQKVFGYRYVLNEVRFSLNDSLKIAFDVTNTGSAPFYYDWPVEVALLDTKNHKPVWKSTLDKADIRTWLPGEGWTDPQWTAVSGWSEFVPDTNWNATGICKWQKPPIKNTVEGKFKVNLPEGIYILSLAIIDPAGNLPSLRFATSNYLNGGRNPVGMINFEKNQCDPLPSDFPFDDPVSDNSLHYVIK